MSEKPQGPVRVAAVAVIALLSVGGQAALTTAVAGARSDHPACSDKDAIIGTGGDDVLTGTDGDDVICALGGNDRIDGAGGDDVIIGGGGDDRLTGAAGTDFCLGGDGDDSYSRCEQCPTQAAATDVSFSRMNGKSRNGLYKMLSNGRREKKLSGGLKYSYTSHGYTGAWSADGKRIAFAGGKNSTYLYTAKANGSDRKLVAEVNASYTPDWSPDGSTIAFEVERRDDETFYVYSVASKGGEATALTSSGEGRFHPHWSPDGALLVLEGNTEDYARRALVMKPDGTDERELLPGKVSYSPTWSPNGEQIAFVGAIGESQGYDTPTDLWVASRDGSGATRLTGLGGIAEQAHWSPDGRKIVFLRRAKRSADVYTVNPDGSHLRRLTRDRATETGIRWSPDATRILFSRERKHRWDLWIMDADGGNEQRITRTATYDELEPQWRPRSCS